MTDFSRVFQAVDTVRKEHPGKVLFFRIGDFFEVYDQDEALLASVTGYPSSSREDNGKNRSVAMVPGALLQFAVEELLAKGHKLAIVEPLFEVTDIIPG
jgi:DNA mismatch repair protein MutS